jgi:hypothetical protein
MTFPLERDGSILAAMEIEARTAASGASPLENL